MSFTVCATVYDEQYIGGTNSFSLWESFFKILQVKEIGSFGEIIEASLAFLLDG